MTRRSCCGALSLLVVLLLLPSRHRRASAEYSSELGKPEPREEDHPNFPLAQKWGNAYRWLACDPRDPARAAVAATAFARPAMVIVHREGCSACWHLQSDFKTHNEAQRLSRNFAMVHCNATQEPAPKAYAPDGEYVPRVLFSDAGGVLQPGLVNEAGHGEFKYYYHDAASLAERMRTAAVALLGARAEL